MLAWAELPCDAEDDKLISMFDDSEPWNTDTKGPGIIMQAVWLHELGHLMGLFHSDSRDDLMAPYYNPQIITLQPGDIARLKKLYRGTEEEAPAAPEPKAPEGLQPGAYKAEATIVVRDNRDVVVSLKGVQKEA